MCFISSCGLMKSALLLILFMSHVEGQALTSPFAKSVNGELVCEEVIESDVIMPKSADPEDGFYSVHNYMCAVSPEYSVSGVSGITLKIKNVDESFKGDYEKARSRGHTELVVQNPLLYNSTLELPTDDRTQCDFTQEGFGHAGIEHAHLGVWLAVTKLVHPPDVRSRTLL